MPARKPSAKDFDQFRALLLQIRGALSGDITNLERDAFGIDGEKAGVDNQADSGSDSFYQEFSLELLERDENALREIDEAIVRIENGSFGACESCGQYIRKERLRAMPHARNCIECQRQMEHGP